MLKGGEAEISAILVPGHAAGGALGFPPHGGVEHQDVGSDQVLDRVQDRRFANQVGGPGEQQIRFHTIRNGSGKGRGGLRAVCARPFDIGSVRRRDVPGKGTERK